MFNHIIKNTRVLCSLRVKFTSHKELSYKFRGEIERGQQNPSFDTFIKIAAALNVDLPELFRFEQIATDKKTAEDRLYKIIKAMTDEDIRRLHTILNVLYPAS